MVEVIETVNGLSNFFSGETNLLLVLLFFTAIIVVFAVFVFYFYKYLAKKNLVELNLNQYNRYANPSLVKFFAGIFYIIEYLIILPILTFFWFAVLAILILVLSEGMSLESILLISAALIASVRVTSYVSESLSRDLAKMLPFTLLAIAITKPGFFTMSLMLTRIKDIPSLFTNLPYYLLFIVGIELIMRILTSFEGLFRPTTEEPESETE